MKHNRRLKRLIGSGFNGRPSGFFFGTLTAPGADVLPWDTSECKHRSNVRCSGKIGCQVERIAAARWNGCAPQAWSWFMTALRRELGTDVQFWKCWETQSRGLLHAHVIVWCQGVTEDRFRAAWEAVAAIPWTFDHGAYSFGWGEQLDVQRIGSALNVAELIDVYGMYPDEAIEAVQEATEAAQRKFVRYGAKYCTKGGKRAVTVNRKTGELRADGAGYRTWSASSTWGLRMKRIRVEQRMWAADARASARATITGAGAAGALDSDADFYAGTNVTAAVLDSAVDPLPV